MLVGLTLVTGLVDAFSYLVLGHVFVANMTGNVVFLAFALAGEHGFSLASSLVALVSFFLGAFIAGKLGSRLSGNRGLMLSGCSAFQAILLAVAVCLDAVARASSESVYLYGIIILLALSMAFRMESPASSLSPTSRRPCSP